MDNFFGKEINEKISKALSSVEGLSSAEKIPKLILKLEAIFKKKWADVDQETKDKVFEFRRLWMIEPKPFMTVSRVEDVYSVCRGSFIEALESGGSDNQEYKASTFKIKFSEKAMRIIGRLSYFTRDASGAKVATFSVSIIVFKNGTKNVWLKDKSIISSIWLATIKGDN